MKITIEQFEVWGTPFRGDDQAHLDENTKGLFSGRESLTPAEVVRMGSVDIDCRIRVLLRPQILGAQFMPTVKAIVDRAVRNHCFGCGDESIEEWAHRWLSGKCGTTIDAIGTAGNAEEEDPPAYAAAYTAHAAAFAILAVRPMRCTACGEIRTVDIGHAADAADADFAADCADSAALAAAHAASYAADFAAARNAADTKDYETVRSVRVAGADHAACAVEREKQLAGIVLAMGGK
jgi:hypothetical protein